MDLDSYLTEENLRLVVVGAGASALTVGLSMLLRRSLGWLLGAVAPLLALFASSWLSWTDPIGEWVVAWLVVGLLAGLGYERVGGGPFVAPLLLLGGLGGVWLAVPENNPALVVAGLVVGLALFGRLSDPGVGWGLSVAAAWAVVLGARDTGWSFVGGLLCLSPLVAVGLRTTLLSSVRGRLAPWPWLVAGGGAVSFAAARWVGVAPDASWARVAVVGAAAGALALLVRR